MVWFFPWRNLEEHTQFHVEKGMEWALYWWEKINDVTRVGLLTNYQMLKKRTWTLEKVKVSFALQFSHLLAWQIYLPLCKPERLRSNLEFTNPWISDSHLFSPRLHSALWRGSLCTYPISFYPFHYKQLSLDHPLGLKVLMLTILSVLRTDPGKRPSAILETGLGPVGWRTPRAWSKRRKQRLLVDKFP